MSPPLAMGVALGVPFINEVSYRLLVQEADGISDFLLEDGSGSILLET